MTQTLNVHAQALGRLGRGVKKTMSPAAIRARRRAAKFKRPNRKKQQEVKAQ
jgi:hypothetical protein